MSSGISPIGGQRVTSQSGVTPTPTDPRIAKLKTAATEFESLLVKQLLKAAKLGGSGGDEKSNGYGDMAVDALATAVERGGGLGLASRIEQAVGGAAHRTLAPALTHSASEKAPGPHGGGG